MKYRPSKLDHENLQWFSKDMTRGTLVSIRLLQGAIRGLTRFDMEFGYPISVVGGANGSGKSTILALAACAFHNDEDSFHIRGRRLPYYTMSDFFFQSVQEVPIGGVRLRYEYLYDDWAKAPTVPDGVGRGGQNRSKKRGGKWTHYARRPHRNVVFFGIERVVPHSERSVSKSHRTRFSEAEEGGYEEDVRDAVGRILGRTYEGFWFREHSKYRLPHVTADGTTYSGFNMGAGENALFEIFSTIYAAPPGLLLVVDELELGLHESAQKRFVEELKLVCKNRHAQVICTTHSPTVLGSVPPEGRFLVERHGERTTITQGVSPEYAAGRLAERNSQELDVYLEDGVAKDIVQAVLSIDIRRRVNLLPIGSAAAVVRQMAARYRERAKGECVAILDGDQKAKLTQHTQLFARSLETVSASGEEATWFQGRVAFLPGDAWPEEWAFSQFAVLDRARLAQSLNVDDTELLSLSQKAATAGKHREFETLSRDLCLDASVVCSTVCRWVAQEAPDCLADVVQAISSHLD